MSTDIVTRAGKGARLTNAELDANFTNLQATADGAAAAVAQRAPLASPALTGTPTVPNAAAGTNTAQAANTAFVQAAITALVGGAGTGLDTLGEIAAAINNDAAFYSTVATALAARAALAGARFTGRISVAPVTLNGGTAYAAGSTVATDASLGNEFRLTLAGNATLAIPTNLADGQRGEHVITQNGTGGWTLTWASGWKFAGRTAPTLSSAANARDRLTWSVNADGTIDAALVKDFG
ncbi:MAG: hypothetical protein ACOYOH_27080 [Paracraurococcus sp.]